MHLDALVIAIGRAPRVRDLRDLARRSLEHHRGGVDITRRSDRGIDQARADRVDLDRLLAKQKPRHVEIVNHHVPVESAGTFDKACMGRLRVARDDRHRLDVPNLASRHAASQCTEARIETTIESDHQPTVRTTHHIETGADSRRAEIDRLFAEYGLAGAHRALDQIRMGIGRRADDDRVYVRRRDNRIDRADRRAMAQRAAGRPPHRHRRRRRDSRAGAPQHCRHECGRSGPRPAIQFASQRPLRPTLRHSALTGQPNYPSIIRNTP